MRFLFLPLLAALTLVSACAGTETLPFDCRENSQTQALCNDAGNTGPAEAAADAAADAAL